MGLDLERDTNAIDELTACLADGNGPRTEATLAAVIRCLQHLQQRPAYLPQLHNLLLLIIDAAFGIQQPECWMNLTGSSAQRLLSQLLSPEGGVLFYSIFSIQISPKYRIPNSVAPAAIAKMLSNSKRDDLQSLPFFSTHIFSNDSFEINIFEYFFIGVAITYLRQSYLGSLLMDSKLLVTTAPSKSSRLFVEEFFPMLLKALLPSVQSPIMNEQSDSLIVVEYQMERAREFITVLCEWWLNSSSYDHTDPEFCVPPDSIYHCSITLVDALLTRSAPFELIDLMRGPLFRFLSASFLRYPLGRISDVTRWPVELWLHWTMPWRLINQPVKLWDAYIQTQLPFYSVLLSEFMVSALHIKLVDADPMISKIGEILNLFADDNMIEILLACESKLGLLYAHASVDWRRFEALASQPPTEYIPFRDPKTKTYRAALQLFTSASIALQAQRENHNLSALCKILEKLFHLDPNAIDESTIETMRRAQIPVEHPPTPYLHNDGYLLTPEQKTKVRQGLVVCSKLDVPFIGGEWERPVAAWESAILVHFLHRIAMAIEKRFPTLAPIRLRWLAAPSAFFQVLVTVLIAYLFSKLFF